MPGQAKGKKALMADAKLKEIEKQNENVELIVIESRD